jgi:hypothetical protein
MLFTLILTVQALAAESYGQGITLKDTPIALTEAVKNMKAHEGKEIVVKANVEKVCQTKGCWIVLKDGDTQVHVQFTKHSFFVPKDSAQTEAVVQGKLFEKEISASAARHYARDAKMPEEEIAKIQSPKKMPWFESTGLTISKK